MKLRIKGNTLRLRLSQTEVSTLQEDDEIKDYIEFVSNTLTYMLEVTDLDQPHCDFKEGRVVVQITRDQAKKWFSPQEVGFQFETKTKTNKESIVVLVEKDFKCLTDRPNEDESDLFENPLQGTVKC